MNEKILSFLPDDPTIVTLGRKANPDKCADLADTLERDGQINYGLVAPVPPAWQQMSRDALAAILRQYIIAPADFTPLTRWVNIDGNRRMTGRWMRGLDYKARALDELPPAIEAVRLGWQANESSQKMTVWEKAEYIYATKMAMPDASWEEVAFSMNRAKPATILLAVQPRNIPEGWRHRAENLKPTVICELGKVRKLPQLDEALTFACGPDVTLAMVRNFIKGQRRTVGRKPKSVETVINGRIIRFDVSHGENKEPVVADVEELLKRIRRYGDGDATGLGFHLPKPKK